jgi:hypothetical protein
MEWMPIETAPKDGTSVLAHVSTARWDVGEDCCSPRSNYRPFIAPVYWEPGSLGGWRFCFDFNTNAEAEPTHWMPLPPTPKEHP